MAERSLSEGLELLKARGSANDPKRLWEKGFANRFYQSMDGRDVDNAVAAAVAAERVGILETLQKMAAEAYEAGEGANYILGLNDAIDAVRRRVGKDG